MKKMVYLIIGLMAIVGLVNISAIDSDSTITIESNEGILLIDPLY